MIGSKLVVILEVLYYIVNIILARFDYIYIFSMFPMRMQLVAGTTIMSMYKVPCFASLYIYV